METLELAKQIAQEALDTKAKDLRVLDLRNLVSYTDYFILGTGTSDRHVKSIADRVHLKLKKEKSRLPISFEGYGSGQWVLLDYGDVVLHVFQAAQRKYYGLDAMWADAPEIPLDGVKPSTRAKAAPGRRGKAPTKAKAPRKRAAVRRKKPAAKKKKR